MAQRIPIQLHVGHALRWLGTLYRNPADALKEHVSNAIDEHVKARSQGTALDRCDVIFKLDRRQIVVEYPYGMTRGEFERALQRVADSAKRAEGAETIGRLGIGMFSFQQLGRRCTFLSRKSAASDTLRVVLKEGADEAIVETALARDRLQVPGLRVVISELTLDPMRPRGPLAPDALARVLGEKFDAYLREGWLTIHVVAGTAQFAVFPPRLRLPPLLTEFKVAVLPGRPRREVRLDLYFDPGGRGKVAIRHRGVAVVDDLRAANAYGLEDSVYTHGHVRGHIDAEFLAPSPARSQFEENDDWIALLDLLDRYRPTLESEVEEHLAERRAQVASDIEARAIRLARDILDLDEFRDLALPGGLARRTRPVPAPRSPAGRQSAKRRARSTPAAPGEAASTRGRRIGYKEVAFENDARAHSRFVNGIVQANSLHPDYQHASKSLEARLTYAAILIGKETIAFNDQTGQAADYLEKLLDYWFKLQTRRPGSRRKATPREQRAAEQSRLELGGDAPGQGTVAPGR
ncbi:MAG: ATP-binding protein [Acidobacteria bacterium]|nr:ATP-binding protein [Acidobacteriota bacterium]MCA1649921.1 ATP-binding protein [Acidobacteriota bacterium]